MADYRAILRQYWGYPDFRGVQREIIESIGAGKDTLGLMPTGGGKSVTFQVPALAMEGVCLVITPLVSLMKDQVDHLLRRGIRAAAIHAGLRRADIVQTLENAIFGGLKLLYISPERLSSDLFRVKLRHIKVSFITVDEAHCISQWGYDFRPSYLQIAQIRQILPHVPVLALTATATPQVVEDIQRQLQFRSANVFRMSFSRENLSYIVRRTLDKEAELVHILRKTSGSAIVYTRSRETTKEYAKLLQRQGISATWYHAGLEASVKEERQNLWQADKVRVMVATNAFGMGIDKPDVTLVIHPDAPNSIEEYFQEAGRAGRDGNRAYAVLLYDEEDARKLKGRISTTFPDKDFIRTIYNQIAYFFVVGVGSGAGHTFEFSMERFCHFFHQFPTRVHAALEILQRAGYIGYEPNPDSRARLKFLLNRNDLYFYRTTPAEDTLIGALLRAYGGLFVDYCFIDESLVAGEANLSREEVYTTLRGLDKKGIVKFIPRKNVPLITYRANRIDGEDVVLTREVYEDRKADFEKRILSMIAYCEETAECRSRVLLRYFGETDSTDCGHCDICIGRRKEEPEASLREEILRVLSDHQGHAIAEIKERFGQTEAGQVLTRLMAEEAVTTDGTSLWLA